MPDRIQLRKRSKLPPNCVDVGPSTPWANPFIIGSHRDGKTEECVAKYARLLRGVPTIGSCCSTDAQRKLYQYAQAHLHELRGRDVACSCNTARVCHADELLRFVAEQERIQKCA